MIGMMNNGTADVPNEFFGGRKGGKKEFRIYSEKRMLKDKISYGKDGRMLVDGRLAAASEVLEPGQLWDELMMRMMCRAVCDSCIREPAPPRRRFSDYLPWRRRAKRGSAAANAIANAATAVSELQTRRESSSNTPNITPKNSTNDQKSAQRLQSDRHKTSTGSGNSTDSATKNAKGRISSDKEPITFVNAFATRFGKKKSTKTTENDSSSTGSLENSPQQSSSAVGGKAKSYGAKQCDNNDYNKYKPNNSGAAAKTYSSPKSNSPNAYNTVQLRNGSKSTIQKSTGNISNGQNISKSTTTTSKAKRPTSTATEEMISALATKISAKVSRRGSNTMTNVNVGAKQNRIVRSTSSSSLKAFNVVGASPTTNAVLRSSEQTQRTRRPLSISTLTALATKSVARPAYKTDNTTVSPGPRRPLHPQTTASSSISTRFFGHGGNRMPTQTSNQTNMQRRFSKVR